MTTPNNDTQPAEQPVSEAEQLQELRKLMIKRMLEQAGDPDIKASGLAVIAKFLEQAGVIAPRLPPQKATPTSRLPFPAETARTQATDEQRGQWSGLEQQPFIVQ